MPKIAIAFSQVDTAAPAHHVRSVPPMEAAYACQSLPLVIGPTVSEYYGLIRFPRGLPLSYLAFRPAYLSSVGDTTHVPTQEPLGSPKPALSAVEGSLMLLSTHTALLVNPGRPSGIWPGTRIPLCGLPVC
jgi:hypothetical protein